MFTLTDDQAKSLRRAIAQMVGRHNAMFGPIAMQEAIDELYEAGACLWDDEDETLPDPVLDESGQFAYGYLFNEHGYTRDDSAVA